MKRLLLVMLLVGVASPASSKTAWVSGNYLYDLCKGTDTFGQVGCSSYVIGVADALNQIQVDGLSQFCVPKGAVIEQITDVARKYLNENPERRHFAAHSLVTTALSKSFPCK